ncbi:hypothetical protein [Agarivorans sp. QJM3NY_33]|uniref:hypothetical protein n=1 Tax=Agarivorans sp. QJM3NY_33 TaxID=3421432 RepID=UPI003D7DDCF1
MTVLAKLLAWGLSLLLLVALSGLLGLKLALSTLASIPAPPAPSPQQVADVKHLLQENMQRLGDASQPVDILLSSQQLQALSRLSSRAFSQINVETQLQAEQLRLRATITLPAQWFGRYLNLQVSLLQSSQGLQLAELTLGDLSLPAQPVFVALLWLSERYFPELPLKVLVSHMSVPQIDQHALRLQVTAQANVRQTLIKAYQSFSQWQQPQTIGLPIAYYYHKLALLGQQYAGQMEVSLFDYLYPLSFDVALRGQRGSLLVEQQAMIWAVSLFFSEGSLRSLLLKRFSLELPFVPAPSNVRLAGRRDLLLHFSYSAGLRMAAEQGFSASIGEFKELFDSVAGGSGFSFADLAADFTGIQFAQTATSLAKTQAFLQAMRQASAEQDLFPRVDDLSEGLSEQQFLKIYQSSDSALYQQQVFFIRQRIAHLPVFSVANH